MKKKIMVIGGSMLVLGGVFFAGNFVGAGTDWKTNAINQANSDMGAAAYQKKTELIEGADTDIQETVIEELSIEDRQAELQRLLDEYYQMKLDGLTGSESFKQLEVQIQAIQQSILDRYKKEIDTVFTQSAQ
jgi:hypothetical protein